MTLYKAINAAREFIMWGKDEPQGYMNHIAYREMRDKLAALPDKPKSEDEILKIIEDGWKSGCNGYRDILKPLKAANVLFVKED